ncbi:hypothetical protein RSal33209_2952 [Renibacterium salmoninarum ATCC 33209]|uniref:Acyl-CoA carboxylase subunit epsilon n=1 Tax=Renibacterium salmoninarum (strain ATCC 33209 / DSM 20767 / JCM 11484 / NBRC 15589 / NCIMB 2235) TaxID=288705 RepID=A9WU03_RENSM|nr:acyl-CoA carboxylase subunit epsilon [Renibacterium salmoninarum]ABY24674.1 hypothetical protein RSal33209_2952 [Renibacterium salmoninarum ATCC 33209]
MTELIEEAFASELTAQLPLFQVTKENPNAEDLAALTAVVLALASAESGAEAADSVEHGRAWIRRERLRLAPTPGPGAWRRSAWR